MNSFLILGISMLMMYASVATRIQTYMRILTLQGVLLFLIVGSHYSEMHVMNFLFLCAETLIFKAFLIPWVITKSTKRLVVHTEHLSHASTLYSFLMTSLVFVFGFYLCYFQMQVQQPLQALYFGVSVAVIISGLLMMLTRRKLITHLIAFVCIENGIFLLSFSVLKEMPLIVDLGVLLELMFIVLMYSTLLEKIKHTFDKGLVDDLAKLHD